MKVEDFEIFLEDFCDFLDGLEASVAKMKMQIAKEFIYLFARFRHL